jgi:8-oxo-dGTP pyrophosphatase MutT (NUDIX family)
MARSPIGFRNFDRSTPMNIRNQARGLVLNTYGQVLLVQYDEKDPDVNYAGLQPDILTYWVAPGGRVEAGETYEEAMVREVLEETGVHVSEIGPRLCIIEKPLMFGGEVMHMHAEYFIAWCDGTPVASNCDPGEGITDVRWWSYEEIERTNEIIRPSNFLELFSKALETTEY